MKYSLEYNDNLPEWVGGKCYYPFFPLFGTCKIVIRPKYGDDIGIKKHEIKHAEQYSRNIFHSLFYWLSDKYRYKCELEAYACQIKEYKYTNITQAEWIINALTTKYGIDIDRALVKSDIEGIVK